MNWTYDQYLSNPHWFNEMLVVKMNADATYEKDEARKMEAKAKKKR